MALLEILASPAKQLSIASAKADEIMIAGSSLLIEAGFVLSRDGSLQLDRSSASNVKRGHDLLRLLQHAMRLLDTSQAQMLDTKWFSAQLLKLPS